MGSAGGVGAEAVAAVLADEGGVCSAGGGVAALSFFGSGSGVCAKTPCEQAKAINMQTKRILIGI